MKLLDELKQIGQGMADKAWPTTTARLAELMRERARTGGYGVFAVEPHSQEVETMLKQWATEQGFEFKQPSGRTVLLQWGYMPGGMGPQLDAEIRADGTLVEKQTR